MLRKYKKNASMKKWCFMSSFFSDLNYATPDQIRLYEQTPIRYVYVCSKLLYLAAHDELAADVIEASSDIMDEFDYWKNLGFENLVNKEEILSKIKEFKQMKKAKKRKLFEAKRLLVELMINRQYLISNDAL
ncbi:MAG: hypothetical protein EXX96DRAFT_551685 [Benjaminiella poitrasii]|nr:MAG: hypothetical protein EXX96DRAFT_551685 [Benjaminiella poitrasii]